MCLMRVWASRAIGGRSRCGDDVIRMRYMTDVDRLVGIRFFVPEKRGDSSHAFVRQPDAECAGGGGGGSDEDPLFALKLMFFGHELP